jgi:hypothetical protein
MPLGRLLIVLGLVLLVAGLLLTYTNIFSSLRLGRLPGDISIKRENFSFYFPVTSCVLVSLVLTLIFYLLRK